MENNLTVFESIEFGKIRTMMINNEPYFVGEDVASALGYAKTNTLSVHVDECDTLNWSIPTNLGKVKNTIVINEHGLYSLIFSSKSPAAKQFEKWIKNDVLPSIKEEKQVITEDNLMMFEGKQVEVFEWNGQVLFNPYHVGECLGIKNIRDNLSKMNEKQVIKLTNSDVGNTDTQKLTNSKVGITDFRKLNNTGENFLTQSGVYKLIFKSRKPEAERFQDWVTDEVLPSIHKHGIYATDNVIDTILKNPDFGIQLLSQLKEERAEREKLKTENLQQKQLIGELKPKADYTDIILKSKSLVTITQIAKDYGMSGGKFNKILHKLGVQYKQNGQWLLYSKHQEKGYTHSKTIHFNHSDGRPDTKMITEWTQKGRLFLYELLKKSGVLPMIEKDIVA